MDEKNEQNPHYAINLRLNAVDKKCLDFLRKKRGKKVIEIFRKGLAVFLKERQ